MSQYNSQKTDVEGTLAGRGCSLRPEFGAFPHDPLSEDEANVSLDEEDYTVIARKRFRGLLNCLMTFGLGSMPATTHKRSQEVTMRRACRPRVNHSRELRPLRSDASVELGADHAPIGQSLRSRLVASWLVHSHTRHLDDIGLFHWRSGQALADSDSSEHSP